MTIASDLNDPNFVGAMNPDSLLHVEFYRYAPINKWASEQKSMEMKRNITVRDEEIDFVRIMKPGDQNSILETAVREEHKQRWPEKWLYYQITQGQIDPGGNVPGWKVEDWDELKEQGELLSTLKFKRFYTVEQIAGASDAQIQNLGIGGLGLREKARVALRNKMGSEVKEEIEKKDREVAELKKANETMQEQMKALMAKVEALTQPPSTTVSAFNTGEVQIEVVQKRKGRPKGSKNKPKAE